MRCAAFLSAFVTMCGIASLHASQSQLGLETSGTGSAFAGDWVANIPKSKLHPSFRYDSVTLQITVTAETVTMATEIVSADKKFRAAETFRTDGTPTPGTLNPGIVLMAHWVGSRVLASVAEKNNQVVALVT